MEPARHLQAAALTLFCILISVFPSNQSNPNSAMKFSTLHMYSRPHIIYERVGHKTNQDEKPSLSHNQLFLARKPFASPLHLFCNQIMMGNKPRALHKLPSHISHAEYGVHSRSAHNCLEAPKQQLNPIPFTNIIIVIASINS